MIRPFNQVLWQNDLVITTQGRGLYEITDKLNTLLVDCGSGLLNVFIKHTSASLCITENADPTVLKDLEYAYSKLAPDADAGYQHNYEGDDDMAAHIRSLLSETSLSVPVSDGRLSLGTWQGIFLWEHRYRGRNRTVQLSLLGA